MLARAPVLHRCGMLRVVSAAVPVSATLACLPVSASAAGACGVGSGRRTMAHTSLADVLASEIKHEQGDTMVLELGAEAQDRLSSAFGIESSPGNRKFVMTRDGDGDAIRVVVDAATPEWLDAEEGDDDPGAVTGGDGEEEDEAGENVYFTVVSVVSGDRKLVFDCYSGFNAGLAIRHVHFAAADATDTDLREGDTYTGPEFEDLDLVLQEGFYDFLSARGIDDAFAQDVAAVSEAKEQQEYVVWLENVKGVVG